MGWLAGERTVSSVLSGSALSKVCRKGENVLGGSVISSLNMILTHGPLSRLETLRCVDIFT